MSSPVCAMGSIGDKVEVEVEVAIDTRKDGLRLSREMSMMQTEGNGRDGEISWWTGVETDDLAIMSSEREVWVMGGDGDSDRDQCAVTVDLD